MENTHTTTEYIAEEATIVSRKRLSGLHEHLRSAGVYLLYVFAALLPLWFMPWQTGVDLGREITFGIIIILALVLWLLSALMKGEVRWLHSLTTYTALALVVVFGASTIFSKAPFYSAFFSDSAAEKFSVLALGVVLFLLAGVLFRSQREVWNTVFILIVAGAVSGVAHLVELISGFSLYEVLVPFGPGDNFNVIGTTNGLMLFYAVLFVIAVGLAHASSDLKRWVRYLLWASLLVFFLNILLVNFQTAWIALLGTGIVLFGFTFRSIRTQGVTLSYLFTLAIIVLSIVMILIRTPIFDFGILAEASPSLRSTFSVGTSVFKEGTKAILVGSGPGTFGLDWSLYKPSSINQDPLFWNVRFNQGFSWAATLVATAGVLGVLAFLAFVGAALFSFLKPLLFSEGGTPLSSGIFLGFVALVIASFLYPANLSLVLLLFLCAGMLSFLLAEDEDEKRGERKPLWWEMSARTTRLEAPWAVFLSSLIMISILSFSVAALYGEVGRLRSGFLRHSGSQAFGDGQFDEAITRIARAADIEQNNFRVRQELVQARMQKIRAVIQRANAGENVQQEFQGEVSRADADAQRLVQRHAFDPSVWRTRGTFYELLIPFIPGAERATFESYQRASELDPLNPSVFSDWGRAGLVYTDRLRLLVGQTRGEEQQQLEALRVRGLQEVDTVLTRSIELKPDFATAHFLLSQVAIRLNRIGAAIESTENAKQSAPFDIGVAFQLGLLYYQNNDLGRAQAEFERAVSFNSNYSNALYFLGLIYDRQGDRDAAIAQFARIEELNPDNMEVKRILENLRNGKGALEGIVPPAEPPAQRSSAPVQ